MNKWIAVFLLGIFYLQCESRKPFKPRLGALPFIEVELLKEGLGFNQSILRIIRDTYSTLVAHVSFGHVVGNYAGEGRELNSTDSKGYLMEQSAAVLILKHKIPDILTEVPQRAIEIDWRGEEVLSLQEECVMAGWHFFFKGDKIYPVMKFLLQRNVRAQFLNIVKKNLWCETLAIKFQKAMSNLGFYGIIDSSSGICVRDPDRMAQPCHGMYGAPLICRGRAVAMLMAPDAQWSNCTGHSNLVHLFSGGFLRDFMTCIQGLLEPDFKMDWASLKKSIYEDYSENGADYIPEIYDKVYGDSTSTSDEL